ncbi:MAG: energy transducer TonB [Candidatus Endonucleobacter sp. (ex Gigantidas childressi)]|nr:energy transducer TonB [Candidatus Endonucleobacter sp. (ex Gigantidas childressi)]
MKRHRYKVSFLITALIYTALIISYIYIPTPNFIISQKEKNKIVNISLAHFVPTAIEQSTEETEEPKPEPKLEPEPEPKPKPKPEPEPEPEPETVVKKELIGIIPRTKKIKKNTEQKNIARKIKNNKHVSRGSSKRATSSRVDQDKKSQYLSEIRESINKKKSYPKIAIRKGMHGIVKVRFTILKNGYLGNITVSGPKVFYNSTKSAVKKAFPIDVKDTPLELPISINLSLSYKLH